MTSVIIYYTRSVAKKGIYLRIDILRKYIYIYVYYIGPANSPHAKIATNVVLDQIYNVHKC